MRTLAVLPVKSFDAAKGRLRARLGPAARAALAEAMLGDVLAAVSRASEIDGVAVVTAEARAAAVARSTGGEILHDAHEAGQSPAAAIGIARAVAAGYDRVVLLPGDTPLLMPADLDGLCRRAAAEGLGAAIVSDRHGTGTNALLLRPPDALAPSFGPDSLARHVASAHTAGVVHAVERIAALEHDVDTPEDLAALAARLSATEPTTAPRTRAALARIEPARDPRSAAEA
ncbi:MAG: 2-phospho-L-lactate guanylyltransferase [Thermoleophilaceae bacterium]|jgi:2-phospho-L-lactate guanylyltransferase|nr:2-phospho-L-lactate guanylyltransferase [Thermoleophilaceae bacterium]